MTTADEVHQIAREIYAERAAICEYCGGLPRVEAELIAAGEVRRYIDSVGLSQDPAAAPGSRIM